MGEDFRAKSTTVVFNPTNCDNNLASHLGRKATGMEDLDKTTQKASALISKVKQKAIHMVFDNSEESSEESKDPSQLSGIT